MLILRNLSIFGVPIEDMVNIYILYIRSIIEQSCVVWHSSLTDEQSLDLERIQKVALRIILLEKYEHYQNALFLTNLDPLFVRRKALCLRFAQSCLKSERSCDMFPAKVKTVNTRPNEKYFVTSAQTNRLAQSSILYMQRLLNEDAAVRK